jgi:hypothetical protein
MKFSLATVLSSLLPVLTLLVGLAAKSIVQVIRRVSDRVDKLPTWQMRAVLLVVTTGLTIARHFLPGVDLPSTVDGYSVDVVSGLLSMLVAHGAHTLEHPKGVAR